MDNYLAGDTPESAWANGRGLYELINNGNMTSANTIFPVWYSVALALGRFTTEELPVMNARRVIVMEPVWRVLSSCIVINSYSYVI